MLDGPGNATERDIPGHERLHGGFVGGIQHGTERPATAGDILRQP